uniref:Endoplasmic reticulum-Golgi intermediate compartment protein n=1 Tax=Callorhinchus milii TaxID=7868 RepID=A0A4W3GI04_CALMI
MKRINKKTLNLMRELDAFPKIPESYVETSTSGGTVSLIAFGIIALLSIMEFFVYRETWMKYDYEGLKYEPTMFELSPSQRRWQRALEKVRRKVQEEHSLQDLLFKSVFKGFPTALPHREEDLSKPYDACRIHGHLHVNKVAGNFHITVGKAIPHPRGHAHMAALVSHDVYNFSHRIDHFSFGEPIPGIINPLDGTEKIAIDHNQMFQYFITIVPTKLNTHKFSADTHQYSVTERERVINHAAGSHGVSGIFMKYDISSLMVTVTEQHMPLGQFLVRLCGIIGGIFSTTGMLHRLVGFSVDVICCRFKIGAYKLKSVTVLDSHMNNHSLTISDGFQH